MHLLKETLLHHLGKTAEILVFLLGAMTIVEIISYFNGFSTIKNFIKTKKKISLLWIFCWLAFVLSAIIDNLTATIVLISLLQKLVKDSELRLWFAGLIVIAANAGGAFSPIGDVTTTMLWIAHKVSTSHLFGYLLLPSLICMLVPTFLASKLSVFKGNLEVDDKDVQPAGRLSGTMFYLGLSAIIFVPVFKMATHLPPYVGMMLSLSIVAVFAEIFSSSKFNLEGLDKGEHSSPVHYSLSKKNYQVSCFLGILMTVTTESLGILFGLLIGLKSVPILEQSSWDYSLRFSGSLVGVGSAVIDNVLSGCFIGDVFRTKR